METTRLPLWIIATTVVGGAAAKTGAHTASRTRPTRSAKIIARVRWASLLEREDKRSFVHRARVFVCVLTAPL